MIEEYIKFVITIGTAVGGTIVFFKGLREYQANNRIKRAEFLEKLIAEFLDAKSEIARGLLDDYVYVTKENREASPLKQMEEAIPLATFLRDHRVAPIRSLDEINVRKSFDNLFDFFTKLSYYLRQELISPKELSYFRYYLEKIEKKSEVIDYIKRYYYWHDFESLIAALKE